MRPITLPKGIVMFNKNRQKIEDARMALLYEIQSLETQMDLVKSAEDSMRSKGILTNEAYETLFSEHYILDNTRTQLKKIVDLLD